MEADVIAERVERECLHGKRCAKTLRLSEGVITVTAYIQGIRNWMTVAKKREGQKKKLVKEEIKAHCLG